jgi:hypothetical protein
MSLDNLAPQIRTDYVVLVALCLDSNNFCRNGSHWYFVGLTSPEMATGLSGTERDQWRRENLAKLALLTDEVEPCLHSRRSELCEKLVVLPYANETRKREKEYRAS